MNISIGKRIWLGFGSLILLTLVVLFLTNRSVNLSNKLYVEINSTYDPSVKKLNEFSFKLEQSKTLINYWAYVESLTETQEKQKFLEIVHQDLPRIKAELDTLATEWERDDVERKFIIYDQLDELMTQYQQIQEFLPDFSSYQGNSGMNWFMARDMTEEGGEIHKQVEAISYDLSQLIEGQRRKEQKALAKMIDSFDTLQFYSTYIGAILILMGIVIALLTARSIVSPVLRLKEKLSLLGKGVLPSVETSIRKDEIGEMVIALNNLIQGQERIRTFVNSLGSGDFTAAYSPLSHQDELAPDFIKTRDALAENERITEKKITERTKELQKKNHQINEQSKKVTELYTDLRDSIEYAKRLQDSMLPTEEGISKMFPKSFVYFEPKDIVSGDFYWMEHRGNKGYIAAVDCTGHGVPGAFMSLIGYNGLKEAMALSDPNDPGDILSNLNRIATNALNRNKGTRKVRDGMDAALCIFDRDKMELSFAGAMRPLIYFKNGEIGKIRGDRMAIGSMGEEVHRFTSHRIKLSPGDSFYIFSDGYADQFGGDREGGKKYKVGRFLDDLATSQQMDMKDQVDKIRYNLMNWQGDHAQVDDILVIGVEVD